MTNRHILAATRFLNEGALSRPRCSHDSEDHCRLGNLVHNVWLGTFSWHYRIGHRREYPNEPYGVYLQERDSVNVTQKITGSLLAKFREVPDACKMSQCLAANRFATNIVDHGVPIILGMAMLI